MPGNCAGERAAGVGGGVLHSGAALQLLRAACGVAAGDTAGGVVGRGCCGGRCASAPGEWSDAATLTGSRQGSDLMFRL